MILFYEQIGFIIGCGSILYSQAPNRFKLIHGISGTLDFSEGENEILQSYGFERKSFIPSTFNKQILTTIPTYVYPTSQKLEYFNHLYDIIYSTIRDKRCTLIFFDTKDYLNEFNNFLKNKSNKLPNYRSPELLHEERSLDERSIIIERCIANSKFTLCTSGYIRGTDFKCRDKELQRHGGVHVVLTFYPKSKSDMIQAKGRSCRQNDPGSFEIVLYEDYLINSGFINSITDKDEYDYPPNTAEPNKWDIFLEEKQYIFGNNAVNDMKHHLEENQPLERETYELKAAIEQNDHENAERLLNKFLSQ